MGPDAVQGISESVALVNLAYNLYTRGYQVAKHAPADFRKLRVKVGIIKKILWAIHVRVNWSTLPSEALIRDAFNLCSGALEEFQQLLRKYESLAYTNRGISVKAFVWANEKRTIDDCRQRLNEAIALLPLALELTSARNNSDQQQEPPELDQQEQETYCRAQQHFSDHDSTYSSASHRSPIVEASGNGKAVRNKSKLPSPVLESTSDEPFNHQWYPPLHSQAEDRESLSTTSGGLRWLSLDPERQRHEATPELHLKFDQALKRIPREVDLETWLCISTWWLLKSKKTCEALTQLASEQSDDTLDLTEAFWESRISLAQASVDLVKSSWILEEILLKADHLALDRLGGSLVDKISDVVAAVDSEFRLRRAPQAPFTISPPQDLLGADVSLIETYVQAAEDPRSMPSSLGNLWNPQRFLTLDINHTGFPGENIIFRKFVNASFGPRGFPTKSTRAPYLLLLSCQSGSSDLFISLCNQGGTLNLSRAAHVTDFSMFQQDSRKDGSYGLTFPEQRGVIKFLTTRNRDEFRGHLKRYFESFIDRNPRENEIGVYRGSLNVYENDISSTLRDPRGQRGRRIADTQAFCEINLFEQAEVVGWKSTRRLVVSSHPASNVTFCTSHWLPLSRVRVQRNDEEIVLSWSDCQQLDSRSDGEYARWYAYVYKADHPNRSIRLEFKDARSAEQFANAILCPFEMPFKTPYAKSIASYKSKSGAQELRLFELSDLDEADGEGCLALVSIKKKSSLCHISDVYFIHRDIDFELIGGSFPILHFSQLRIPYYISDMVDLPRPDDNHGEYPRCKDVVQRMQDAKLSFDLESDLSTFMESLLGWKPRFSETVDVVSHTHGTFFWTNLKKAGVQIWSKGADENGEPNLQVVVSGKEKDEATWITTSYVDLIQRTESIKNGKAQLKSTKVRIGNALDTTTLQAVDCNLDADSRDQNEASEHSRRIEIVFQNPQQLRRFMDQLRPAALCFGGLQMGPRHEH